MTAYLVFHSMMGIFFIIAARQTISREQGFWAMFAALGLFAFWPFYLLFRFLMVVQEGNL